MLVRRYFSIFKYFLYFQISHALVVYFDSFQIAIVYTLDHTDM